MGQHTLQRQHQPRRLATRGNACHRFERLAGVGADHKFDLVDAGTVKGNAAAIHQIGPFGLGPLFNRNTKAGARHA